MRPRSLDSQPVAVDMVPLIDIISLLLMFLLIVGNMSEDVRSIDMKLPRASEGVSEKTFPSTGRLVVQLRASENGYSAVLNNRAFALAANGSPALTDYVQKYAAQNGKDFPVKLRVPKDAPMQSVEHVVKALAESGITSLQYAALAEAKGGQE